LNGGEGGEIGELSFGLHPMLMIIKTGHRIPVAIAGHDEEKTCNPV